MMKNILAAIFITIPFFILNAQNIKKMETYHDPYTRTKIHEAYTVISEPPYKKHGLYREWDGRGTLIKEVNYNNGKYDGVAKTYYNASMAQAFDNPYDYYGKIQDLMTYSNGILNGAYKRYGYKNGKQQLLSDKTYESDEVVAQTDYHDNGQKKSHVQMNGACGEWYENGQKKAECMYKNGEAQGQYKSWHSNGQIESSGSLNNGDKIGKWLYYHPNGNPKSEHTYDEQSTTINKKDYSVNGTVIAERFQVEGDLFTRTSFDSITGKKTLEENVRLIDPNTKDPFLNHGVRRTWYGNGAKKSEFNYVQGKEDGIGREWYKDGSERSEVSYKNGVGDGTWSFYDPSGKLVIGGKVISGKRVGKWRYHFNENWEHVYTLAEAAYYRDITYDNNGEIMGTVKDFYVTGEKQWEGTIISENPDVINGMSTIYYKNGNKKEEGFMNNGNPEETWRFWYENGNLLSEGSYHYGDKTGEWKYYNESGALIKMESYRGGILMSTENY